jgi:transcriptional regulator with XRE-family HTH domain
MSTPLAVFLARQLDLRQWSRDEFARRTGLTRSHVYFILDGARQNVGIDTIERIAAGLGITRAELFAAVDQDSDQTADEVEVLALYRQLPHDQRTAAKLMLRGLAAIN